MAFAGSIKLVSEGARFLAPFIDPQAWLLGRITRVGYIPGLPIAQDEATAGIGMFLVTDDLNGTNAGDVSIVNAVPPPLRLTTGANNNDTIQCFAGDGQGRRISPFALTANDELAFIVEFTRDSNVSTVLIGFGTAGGGDIVGTPPSNAIALRLKNGDNNVYLVLRKTGTETEENTGFTLTPGEFKTFCLRASRSRVLLMDVSQPGFPYAMVNLANLPDANSFLGFFAGIKTNSAFARQLDLRIWQAFQAR
jgi:hypothetical protein